MKKLISVSIVIFLSSFLYAQTPKDSLDVPVKVTILEIADITLVEVYDYSPTTPGNVQPSADNIVDYFDRIPGVYTIGSTSGTYAIAILVRFNIGDATWTLQTRGTDDFTSGGNTFPLSNLSWALDGDPVGQTWTPFSITYTNVLSNQPVGQYTVYIDYKLNIPWNAIPATDYQTTTRYRLISNP